MAGDVTDLQAAVAYQALYNKLGVECKVNGDGIRGAVDRELREIYEMTGAKSYSVVRDGVKMGTYSIVEDKAAPASEQVVFDLVDREAFAGWLMSEDGIDCMGNYCEEHGEGFVTWCVQEFGVLPDGVEKRVVRTPAKPARYKGGKIVVDRGFLASIDLQTGIAALLGGGGDGTPLLDD